ncbi:MAG TPA: hypothetical protein VJ385_12655 [Fibrobacteria bacterium]|nr:hypothetical protein [Fibrobacteria bacterium]
MALNGIGGGDVGSALERFQALRDSAKKKLAGEDGQAGLAELIRRKQSELGAGSGIAARASAERIPPKPAAAPVPGFPAPSGARGAGGAPVSGAYGRSGIPRQQDPKPTLGRHVDFMA